MKQTIAAILMLPLLCLAESSPSVTLTETNGLSVTGTVLSYSPETGLIKIRQDGTLCQHSFSSFTPESQQDMAWWQSDKNFQSRPSLSAAFQSHDTYSTSNIVGTITSRGSETNREDTIGTETRTFCTYTINLTNKSDTPLKDLTADYRIFFTQPLTEEDIGQYQLAGSADLETLEAGGRWDFDSTPFLSATIYTAAPRINWIGKPPSYHSNIQGIWLRIRKPGLSGEWLEREFEDGEIPYKRNRADYQKVYK